MRDLKVYVENFIEAFENHFLIDFDERTHETFKAVEDAGLLLDYYFPSFTVDATYYKALYLKCKDFIIKNREA